MSNSIKKEDLIAEIEQFKEEALKMHIVEVLADSYTNTSLFAYVILEREDNKIWWMKTQAYQLWKFWNAAKAHEAKKNSSSKETSVILNGHDIKYISEFMVYSDPENIDHEVTIQDCLTGFDGKGLYAWVTEYPEEGGIKLCVEAAMGVNHD